MQVAPEAGGGRVTAKRVAPKLVNLKLAYGHGPILHSLRLCGLVKLEAERLSEELTVVLVVSHILLDVRWLCDATFTNVGLDMPFWFAMSSPTR
eukprot:5911185-Pleurochrysis_carterae.AAC.1